MLRSWTWRGIIEEIIRTNIWGWNAAKWQNATNQCFFIRFCNCPIRRRTVLYKSLKLERKSLIIFKTHAHTHKQRGAGSVTKTWPKIRFFRGRGKNFSASSHIKYTNTLGTIFVTFCCIRVTAFAKVFLLLQ